MTRSPSDVRGVVVTGAAQGIGRGIAQRFLRDGAGVVAFDVNAERLDRTVGSLGERCVAFHGDVARRDDCRRAVELCVERFGAIDVMCAHAGIAEPLPLLEQTEEHWRRHQAINVEGVVWCTVEAARAMTAAGRPGSIVCTSSINAWHVEETMAAYNVSKAAVWCFVRSAAIDLGRHGIRVNGVAPGVVDTPIAAMVVHNPDVAPRYLETMPLGRFGEPQDIASVVAFLASEEAAYVTGQIIVVDGGQTLGITGDLERAARQKGS
jgi:NAD(P)-dependent dehydrogenase (short-subunit alcohol dehydrogenase family)